VINPLSLLSPRKRLLEQAREIEQLKKENDKLRAQNDSMRQGMRRCVTCEYRIDFKQRQGQAPD
jgi:cell division protein FtsB